jgi:hypothetical protein
MKIGYVRQNQGNSILTLSLKIHHVTSTSQIIETFSIITTVANAMVSAVHERMPGSCQKIIIYGGWIPGNSRRVFSNSFSGHFPPGK